MPDDRVRLFVLGNAAKARVRDVAEQLMPLLRERFTIVAYDLHQEADLSQCEADLALVLGGDGAILRAVHQMGDRQVPIVGINLGKLGFLADLSPDELHHQLPALAARQYTVSHQLMLECRVIRQGHPDILSRGVNDLVIQAGPPFRMIDIRLAIDGEPVSIYSGDGLILATPVGSTAHSLAAGGPILRQDIPAFVITPICPHTLTNRPLVDGADKLYEMELASTKDGATLIIDGRENIPLIRGDRVAVRRASATFQLVKLPGHSYYQTLRDKLNWGGRPKYNLAD